MRLQWRRGAVAATVAVLGSLLAAPGAAADNLWLRSEGYPGKPYIWGATPSTTGAASSMQILVTGDSPYATSSTYRVEINGRLMPTTRTLNDYAWCTSSCTLASNYIASRKVRIRANHLVEAVTGGSIVPWTP